MLPLILSEKVHNRVALSYVLAWLAITGVDEYISSQYTVFFIEDLYSDEDAINQFRREGWVISWFFLLIWGSARARVYHVTSVWRYTMRWHLTLSTVFVSFLQVNNLFLPFAPADRIEFTNWVTFPEVDCFEWAEDIVFGFDFCFDTYRTRALIWVFYFSSFGIIYCYNSHISEFDGTLRISTITALSTALSLAVLSSNIYSVFVFYPIFTRYFFYIFEGFDWKKAWGYIMIYLSPVINFLLWVWRPIRWLLTPVIWLLSQVWRFVRPILRFVLWLLKPVFFILRVVFGSMLWIMLWIIGPYS